MKKTERFSIPTNVSPQELGNEIAHHAEYMGTDIMEIAAYALEDANFHRKARIVRELAEINRKWADSMQLTLDIRAGKYAK